MGKVLVSPVSGTQSAQSCFSASPASRGWKCNCFLIAGCSPVTGKNGSHSDVDGSRMARHAICARTPLHTATLATEFLMGPILASGGGGWIQPQQACGQVVCLIRNVGNWWMFYFCHINCSRAHITSHRSKKTTNIFDQITENGRVFCRAFCI